MGCLKNITPDAHLVSSETQLAPGRLLRCRAPALGKTTAPSPSDGDANLSDADGQPER